MAINSRLTTRINKFAIVIGLVRGNRSPSAKRRGRASPAAVLPLRLGRQPESAPGILRKSNAKPHRVSPGNFGRHVAASPLVGRAAAGHRLIFGASNRSGAHVKWS